MFNAFADLCVLDTDTGESPDKWVLVKPDEIIHVDSTRGSVLAICIELPVQSGLVVPEIGMLDKNIVTTAMEIAALVDGIVADQNFLPPVIRTP